MHARALDLIAPFLALAPAAAPQAFKATIRGDLAHSYASLPLGRGTLAAGGFEPRISVAGCPVAGGHLDVVISQLRGGAPGCLVIGEGRSLSRFLCGDRTLQRTLFEFPHVASGVPGQAGAGSASWSLRLALSYFGREVILQAGYLLPGRLAHPGAGAAGRW